MAAWFQNQLKLAEELLEVVDRTAKNVAERDTSSRNKTSDVQKSYSSSNLEKTKNASSSASVPLVPARSDESKLKEIKRTKKSETTSSTSAGDLNAIASDSSSQLKSTIQNENSNESLESNPKSNESIEQSLSKSSDAEEPQQSTAPPLNPNPDTQLPEPEETNGFKASTNSDSDLVQQTEIHLTTSSIDSVHDSSDQMTARDINQEDVSASESNLQNLEIKQNVESSANTDINHVDAGGDILNEEFLNSETKSESNTMNSAEKEQLKNFLSPKPAAVVQEELDEARELLKVSASEGKSREARLARVCASLKTRVQEYRTENSELEKLLLQEVNEKVNLQNTIHNLQERLRSEKEKTEQFEQNMGDNLEAKNLEIKNLMSELKEARRKGTELEERLISVQNNSEEIFKYKEFSEGKMIQALRDELVLFENRYEDEKKSHAETRLLFSTRELELEQKVSESISGLSKMQKILDEKTQKISDVEEKVLLLEQECASLYQEIQVLENQKQKNETKRNLEENSSAIQAWKKEAERARSLQVEAENKLLENQALVQKLRVELETRKREMEEHPNQAQEELEKRYRELTELLYSKQSQLEAVSSEKQAAIFQLEKERKKSSEMRKKLEQDKAYRRSNASTFDEDSDLHSLESLTMKQRRLGPSIQKAAKLLDHGTMTAGRFLWRHPLARLALIFYLVFLHLSLMFVLHRLQQQADELLSQKYNHMEEQTGLVKPNHHLFF